MAGAGAAVEQAGDDGTAAMDMEFGHVFAGEAPRAGENQHQAAIEAFPGIRVEKGPQGRETGLGHGAGNRRDRRVDIRTRHAHDGDTGNAGTARQGENGSVRAHLSRFRRRPNQIACNRVSVSFTPPEGPEIKTRPPPARTGKARPSGARRQVAPSLWNQSPLYRFISESMTGSDRIAHAAALMPPFQFRIRIEW